MNGSMKVVPQTTVCPCNKGRLFFIPVLSSMPTVPLFVLGILVISLVLAHSVSIFRRAHRMVTALFKFSILLFIVQVLVIRYGVVLFTLLRAFRSPTWV